MFVGFTGCFEYKQENKYHICSSFTCYIILIIRKNCSMLQDPIRSTVVDSSIHVVNNGKKFIRGKVSKSLCLYTRLSFDKLFMFPCLIVYASSLSFIDFKLAHLLIVFSLLLITDCIFIMSNPGLLCFHTL